MNAVQQRALVNDPDALERLTEHQRMILDLVTIPTLDGKRRSITGIAAGLKVSRQSIYKTLRLARVNMRGL